MFATGADRSLAQALGCSFDGDLVDVTLSMETSVEDGEHFHDFDTPADAE